MKPRDSALQQFDQFGADCALIPVRGKVALCAYTDLGPGIYGTPDNWANATGYGLLVCADSKLAFLDVDAPAFGCQIDVTIPPLGNPDTWTRYHGQRYAKALYAAYQVDSAITPNKTDGSLRARGQYIVGPGSLHPDGSPYNVTGHSIPELTPQETTALLDFFNKVTRSDNAPCFSVPDDLISAIVILLQANYHAKKERMNRQGETYLDCRCPNPDHADMHPSFRFNISRGFGFCFADNTTYTTKQIAAWLKIDLSQFGAIMPENTPDTAPGRADLIRNGLTGVARALDLLRGKSGQFSRASLVELGVSDFVLRQCINTGYMSRRKGGKYRLTDKALEYLDRTEALPAEVYQGNGADYRAQFYAETIRTLRQEGGQPTTKRLADTAGLSRRGAYRAEKRIGIARIPMYARHELTDSDLATLPKQGFFWVDIVKNGHTYRQVIPQYGLSGLDMTHLTMTIRATLSKYGQNAIALKVTRTPSLRVLPGENPANLIPEGARITSKGIFMDYLIYPNNFQRITDNSFLYASFYMACMRTPAG